MSLKLLTPVNDKIHTESSLTLLCQRKKQTSPTFERRIIFWNNYQKNVILNIKTDKSEQFKSHSLFSPWVCVTKYDYVAYEYMSIHKNFYGIS